MLRENKIRGDTCVRQGPHPDLTHTIFLSSPRTRYYSVQDAKWVTDHAEIFGGGINPQNSH